MKKSTIGGNKRKLANALAMIGLIIVFIAYMFPLPDGSDQFSEGKKRHH